MSRTQLAFSLKRDRNRDSFEHFIKMPNLSKEFQKIVFKRICMVCLTRPGAIKKSKGGVRAVDKILSTKI